MPRELSTYTRTNRSTGEVRSTQPHRHPWSCIATTITTTAGPHTARRLLERESACIARRWCVGHRPRIKNIVTIHGTIAITMTGGITDERLKLNFFT